jgi:hypothetical protein
MGAGCCNVTVFIEYIFINSLKTLPKISVNSSADTGLPDTLFDSGVNAWWECWVTVDQALKSIITALPRIEIPKIVVVESGFGSVLL